MQLVEAAPRMARRLPLLALALFGTSLRADTPTVADLVNQLGDPKFAVREAAQKELIKHGEGIVPELDRLTKGVDAETAERIGKVRYNLVGYKDDIRRLLAEVRDTPDFSLVPISDELRGLIAEHQPGSGNVLLEVLSDPKHKLHRQAVRTFLATWNAATPDQIDAYVRKTVTLNTAHRVQFPAKVGAMISFEARPRDGWTGWPVRSPKGFTFNTRTTRYLDGKPYDKPYEYRSPFATVGWYRVGELSEGKHTIRAVMEYEFTQNGQKRKGQIRSKDSTFEVVSADTPDDLIAPKSVDTANLMRAAFHILGVRVQGLGADVAEVRGSDPDPPQVTWELSPAVRAGVRCPEWVVAAPLGVDLCMEVELRDTKSGKVYPADPICVPGTETTRGYIVPRDVRAFANGRDGLVAVQVVLKPSRALALTDARMKRYYPNPIIADRVWMKVVPRIEPPAERK